jgi:hypothetical protein
MIIIGLEEGVSFEYDGSRFSDYHLWYQLDRMSAFGSQTKWFKPSRKKSYSISSSTTTKPRIENHNKDSRNCCADKKEEHQNMNNNNKHDNDHSIIFCGGNGIESAPIFDSGVTIVICLSFVVVVGFDTAFVVVTFVVVELFVFWSRWLSSIMPSSPH